MYSYTSGFVNRLSFIRSTAHLERYVKDKMSDPEMERQMTRAKSSPSIPKSVQNYPTYKEDKL